MRSRSERGGRSGILTATIFLLSGGVLGAVSMLIHLTFDVSRCPHIVPYDLSFTANASVDLGKLDKDSPLFRMVGDYHLMRKQARSCFDRTYDWSTDRSLRWD